MEGVAASSRPAALSGDAWPDVAPLRVARDALDDHHAATEVLERARTLQAGAFQEVLIGAVDDIITNCLRPKFEAEVAALHAVASLLPDQATTSRLLRAPDEVRRAWIRLEDIEARCARLRDTAARLARLTPIVHDHDGEFEVARNVRDIWPQWRRGVPGPWRREDGREQLLAMVRAGLELWLPSSHERDQAWLDKHGAKVEQAKRNKFAIEGFRAIGG
ncbi:MAG: hypothetical protein WKF73_07640 [Nocardioidaceae bacterium]